MRLFSILKVYHNQYNYTDNVLPFTEASILEAIMPVSNVFGLGQKLLIPDHTLYDITKSPIEEQRQKLVAALFRVRPKCTREEVDHAINEVARAEWVNRRGSNSSMTKSSSLDSVSLFGSISIEGITNTLYLAVILNIIPFACTLPLSDFFMTFSLPVR